MALPAGRRGVRPDQVKPDGTLNVTEPTPYELPVASAETLGGVKVGSGLSIDDGVLSASGYSLPTASADTLGGIKVGSGLSIADGVLSANGSAPESVAFTPATNVEIIKNSSILIGSTVFVSIIIKASANLAQYDDLGTLQYIPACTSVGTVNKNVGPAATTSTSSLFLSVKNTTYPNGRVYSSGVFNANDELYLQGCYIKEEN